MNKSIINRKYDYLITRYNELKRLYEEIEDKFKENPEIYISALERMSEQVIETAIKINIYILKENNIFPKSYQESFLKLKNIINLNENELKKLSLTAKFRNILAHEYIHLEKKNVLKNIENVIKLYPKFIKNIKSQLDKLTKNE